MDWLVPTARQPRDSELRLSLRQAETLCRWQWRQSSALMVKSDIGVDRVHLTLERVPFSVAVREYVVTGPVAKIPRGCLLEESG